MFKCFTIFGFILFEIFYFLNQYVLDWWIYLLLMNKIHIFSSIVYDWLPAIRKFFYSTPEETWWFGFKGLKHDVVIWRDFSKVVRWRAGEMEIWSVETLYFRDARIHETSSFSRIWSIGRHTSPYFTDEDTIALYISKLMAEPRQK